MKKLLIASLLTIGLVGGIQAQEVESRYGKHDGSRIAKKLELTESQLPAFQAIMQTQMEKRRALHEEFRAQSQELETETQQELATVLTPEQLEKLQTMKEKRQEKWREHHDKRGEHKRDGNSVEDSVQ